MEGEGEQNQRTPGEFTGVEPKKFFDAYQEGGVAPWVVNKPQTELVELVQRFKRGEEPSINLEGPVLDLGCGSGDNTIFFAEEGYESLGVDFVPGAVELCNKKKAEKNVEGVHFIVGDATKLEEYPEVKNRDWKTIIDSALFHTFDDETRVKYIDSLNRVVKSNSLLILFCFSDEELRGPSIPRRVSKAEIESNFSAERGWTVKEIRKACYEDTRRGQAYAWLAFIQKN